MTDIKKQLKDIATATVQRGGIYAVTMRELGKAVGIKSSSVMYHFENKDGLLREITMDYRDEFFTMLAEVEIKKTDLRQKLFALLDIFKDALGERKYCLFGMMAAEVQYLDKPTRKIVESFFDRLASWIEKQIKESHHQALKKHAVSHARMLISGLEGALLLDKATGSQKNLDAMKHWIVTVTQ